MVVQKSVNNHNKLVSWNRNSTAHRPFWEFAVHSGCTVKPVLTLVWLSPTPTKAISDMPTGESRGAYGSLIAVDQGAWRLEGIRMCTFHRLGRRDKKFCILFHLNQGRFQLQALAVTGIRHIVDPLPSDLRY